MNLKQTLMTAALAACAAPAFAQCDEQWLFDANPDALEEFGHAVAISGDYAFVGIPSKDVNGKVDSGAMQLFIRNGGVWSAGPVYAVNSNNAEDAFGYSVAMDGDWAIVGAPFADTAEGAESGRALFYSRTSGLWLPSSVVLPSEVSTFDFFGVEVALNGGTAVIGAPGVNPASGGIYGGAMMIFDRSSGSWVQESGYLTGTTTAENDGFGSALAVHDPAGHSVGLIAMGGPGRDRNGVPNAGEVRLFKQYTGGDGTPNWAYTVSIGMPTGLEAPTARFGSSVAVRADANGVGVLAVGAPDYPGDGVPKQGRIFLYRQSGGLWTYWGSIQGVDGQYSSFGTAMSLRGDSLVVTTRYADARQYRIDTSAPTFAEGVRLVRAWTPPAPANTFGASVAQSDTDVIVGDDSYITNGVQYGGAMIGALTADDLSDLCETAIDLTLADPVRDGCFNGFNNEGAAATCYTPALTDDVWFRVAPSAANPAGRYRVSTAGSAFTTALALFDGCLSAGGEMIDCGGQQMEFDLAGSPVYLRVAAYSWGTGHLHVELEALPGCAADLDHDGAVGFSDLLTVLQYWNVAGADIDGDGTTGFSDLTQVLANWGPCP